VKSRILLILVITVLALAALPSPGHTQAPWADQFAGFGIDGQTADMITWNGDLVFGGLFRRQGSVLCEEAVRFDGSTWHPMGGSHLIETTTLGIFGGVLHKHGYGGRFNQPNPLWRWNGIDWEQAVTLWTGAVIRAMVEYQGQFILAGDGISVQGFDGTNLIDLGNRPDDFDIWAVVVLDGILYVGGSFETLLDGAPAHGLAQWDGVTWSAVEGRSTPGDTLSGGIGGDWPFVFKLGTHQGKLVITGDFDSVGDLPANNLALWDPATQLWSTPGGGTDLYVLDIQSFQGELYIGGNFTEVDGQPLGSLARWDGSVWHPVGGGIEGTVLGLHEHDGILAIAGSFHTAGGIQAQSVAFWDGANFSTSSGPSGLGLDGYPDRIHPYQDTFILSGNFHYAGPERVNGLARWNGSGWDDLGGGVNGRMHDSAVHGNDVIAVGEFTEAGGVPANRAALWDGAAWSALGDSLPGIPYAVAIHDNKIHVAGRLDTGFQPFMKRYDAGIGWVDIPVEPAVILPTHLISYQGHLYLGGSVNDYYGPGDPIAYWDGAVWTPVITVESNLMSTGPEGFEIIDGDLHILGEEHRVWDGATLSPLTPTAGLININRTSAITRLGATTFLGAWREYNGETIFRLDPGATSWVLVEDGLDGNVLDLMEFEGKILMAGRFNFARTTGGLRVPSSFFTWLNPGLSNTPHLSGRSTLLLPLQPNPFNPATLVRLDVPEGGAEGTLVVYDLQGRRVRVLKSGTFAQGLQEFRWDGRSDTGREQASGIFLVRLETNNGVEVKKGMLVR
jgi:hypothetical protein